VEGVLALFGADVFGRPQGAEALIVVFHLLGVGLVAWAVCRALRRFFSRDDLLVQVLVIAIAFNLAGYVASVLPVTIIDTREIAPVLPFGAVLAGRLLAGEAIRPRLTRAAAVALACYAAALGFAVAQPAAPALNQALADWLVAHHLDTGLGVYTEDNVTTLDGGGRLLLITASWEPTGAVPRSYQSQASWSDPRLHYANYVVNTSVDGPRSDIPYRDLLAAFGRPAATYRDGTFVIMVWHKNLLDDLGGPPRHGAGNL
jgi:hypothetical protein